MNLNSDPQTPEFPQLASYINTKGIERDIDHDGSPERVDIDDKDARVQMTHHLEKRDGVAEKQSIRERLRLVKPEAIKNQNEKQNCVERGIV